MSKQSEAKAAQGYEEKPEQHVCATCAHFTSKVDKRPGMFGGTYTVESEKRCSIGGFAVKKTATCTLWSAKKA